MQTLSNNKPRASVPIILVGNKVDLHLERCVTYQEGKDLANYMKAQFVEVRSVSALFCRLSYLTNSFIPLKR